MICCSESIAPMNYGCDNKKQNKKTQKMKKAKLGDYLFWKGDLAKIVGEAREKTIIIELLENNKCPHCEGDLGKKQISVIPTSPLFQENSEPIQTIK